MEPEGWVTIVNAEVLAVALGRRPQDVPPIVLLDVRHDLKDPEAGPSAYAGGHIPGAHHAHVDRDLSGPVGPQTGRHPLPDPSAFAATCSRWGIDSTVQVVAYDDVGGAWAGRVWWLLRDAGHAKVAVLDGGLAAWKAAGQTLTTEPATSTPRRFTGRPGHMPRTDAQRILRGQHGRVVDARAAERYRGEREPIDPVAGHIPGARSAPHAGNLGPDGRFLPRDELRQRYTQVLAGVLAKDAAVYCGSGVTAPHDLLAMAIAGLEGAALYPGSWSEWIRDPKRPVARGAEP